MSHFCESHEGGVCDLQREEFWRSFGYLPTSEDISDSVVPTEEPIPVVIKD